MQPDDERQAIAPTNLAEVLVGQPTAQRRLAQWAVLVVVVLSALALVVPSLARAWPHLFAAPKNMAILITSNVNWGTLSVDGIGTTSAGPPQVLMLAPRTRVYHLTFAAAPFPTQSCLLSIPVRPDDSCHPINPADAPGKGIVNIGANASAVVDFAFTPADLSDADAMTVQSVMDVALRARTALTSVPVGGHYASTIKGTTRILTAAQPLAAQLVTERSTQDTDICVTICAGLPFANPPHASPHQDLWNLRFAIRQHWQFTASTSHAVLGATDETLASALLDLTVAYAQGAWALPVTAPRSASINLCVDGEAAFASLTTTEPILAVQAGVALENHAIEGCRLTVQVQQESMTQFSALALVWRFGGLFTADAVSARLLPDLPRASAVDLAALRGGSAHERNA